MIQRVLLAAVAAGVFAGIFITGVQLWKVIPLIADAELYEVAEAPGTHGHADGEETTAHSHGDAGGETSTLERTFYTMGSNIVTGVGFALLLCAAIVLRGEKVNARSGTLWGLAGFAALSFFPAVGLAPEVPGTLAADLGDRQTWWILATIASALGIALSVFGKNTMMKIIGLLVIAVPHIVGAPHPDVYEGLAPAPIAANFVMASMFASLVFWLVIGGVAGFCFERLDKEQEA